MVPERSVFSEKVFEADNHTCIMCGAAAVDAHHLFNRNLWSDGGYHVDNGVSLCGDCHLKAERNEYTVEELRAAAGRKLLMPPGFSYKEKYDTWGNVLLRNGLIAYGPMRDNEGMQKALAHLRGTFTDRVKYPSTSYLPNSPSLDENDTVIDPKVFDDIEIVVTQKMDGENTTLTSEYTHARSMDSADHPTRSWVKQLWAQIRYDIPQGWRINGENVYAFHSIRYDNLETYFYCFSIWNEHNVCLSWDETVEWCAMLGLTPAPVIYRGVYDLKAIHAAWEALDHDSEGYVVRDAGSYSYQEFPNKLAKWVRNDFLQVTLNHDGSELHWMHRDNIEPNRLKTK